MNARIIFPMRLPLSRALAAALAAALATVCFGQAFSQIDPDAPVPTPGQDIKKQRADEIAKFHPRVIGMPAEQRMRGYEKRLQMEKDSPFSQIKWRSVGPEVQSGRVIHVEKGKDALYIAFATGGLWRSEDNANTWTPTFDGQSAFGIGDFAIAKDGKTIWLGTGEANSQRTSYSGTGVFKSPDGGKTWQYMGLPESHHIGRILLDPQDPNTVYVGVLGHLYSQNPERGVYKTTDGGRTWQQALKLNDQTGIIDMAMDPRDHNVIYAAAWDRDRRAWNFRESGPGSGVYKSVDAGKTWKMVTALPHAEDAGRIGLAISQSNPNRVYVYIDNHGADPDWADVDEAVPSGTLTPRRFLLLTEDLFLALDKKLLEGFWRQYAPNDLKLDDTIQQVKDKKMTMGQVREAIAKRGKIFDPGKVQSHMLRSDDGGKTWKQTPSGPLGGNSYYYFGNVIVNPKDPNDIFATGTLLTRSRDGGKTWRMAAREAHVDFHAVWFDPANVKHIIVGCDGGAYESYDDGSHWRHLNNMAVGQATTVNVDNKNPYNVFVGLQDNGTLKGPNTYRPGISDVNQWNDVGGGDGAAIAVDPRDGGDTIYVGYQFGEQNGFNQKTNEQWTITPRAKRGDPPNRYNWVSPVAVSLYHPDIIYFGAQKLYRSFDRGHAWDAISPDLTKDKPNGNVPFSTLKDISESPLKFGVIYAASDDGSVNVTRDGGVVWEKIPTATPDKWVSRIVASKWDIATVYVSQSGYREDDFAPYLYKSTDFGHSWTSIIGDLPPETINVVREDPDRKDILYVGTDMGVFVTFDGGSHWEALQGGLPHTPVHDLVVQARDHDLVIGTHARSAWVLPLKLVYDLNADVRGVALTLFNVADMRRDRTWGYPSRFGQFNEPTIQTLRGSFYSVAAGKATLRIKDKAGKVVIEKSFDAAKGYNFFEVPLKLGEGGPKPTGKRTVTKPGDALLDPFESTRAKYPEAGDYTIELKVGGKTVTQAWKLTAPSS